MSSGDQWSPCTVCGQLGHWESSHAGDAERAKKAEELARLLRDGFVYHDQGMGHGHFALELPEATVKAAFEVIVEILGEDLKTAKIRMKGPINPI